MIETENTIEYLKDKLEEINKALDLSLSDELVYTNTPILAMLIPIVEVLGGIVNLAEGAGKPINLLGDGKFTEETFRTQVVEITNPSARLHNWVEGLVKVQPTNDVGLKLWLCTTNGSRTYFAHALNEDQARSMVDEIYGEDTVVNVFNYDNQYQVMTEL